LVDNATNVRAVAVTNKRAANFPTITIAVVIISIVTSLAIAITVSITISVAVATSSTVASSSSSSNRVDTAAFIAAFIAALIADCSSRQLILFDCGVQNLFIIIMIIMIIRFKIISCRDKCNDTDV
jgi:hypothetical protein